MATGDTTGEATEVDTLYLGFGLEGITGVGNRNDVMGRAIDYLLR